MRSNTKKSATNKQIGAAEASSIMDGQVSLRAAPLIALQPLFFDFVSDNKCGASCLLAPLRPQGRASKQLAPHRRRNLVALFFQRPSTPG